MIHDLPEVASRLRAALDRAREDVRAMVERDPAAKSAREVALSYPGVHAVWTHRLAHRLLHRGHPLVARLLSQASRLVTGVEIHPAAEVGRRVTIDHGMGVVVGETAEVGDDVHLLHGVTLGGTDDRPVKRHPTLRDGVVVGANATLLGPIDVGENAKIGAGAVVTDDVPPGATAVGVPAEVHRTGGENARSEGEEAGRDGDRPEGEDRRPDIDDCRPEDGGERPEDGGERPEADDTGARDGDRDGNGSPGGTIDRVPRCE